MWPWYLQEEKLLNIDAQPPRKETVPKKFILEEPLGSADPDLSVPVEPE
jgi:hypothetical protein